MIKYKDQEKNIPKNNELYDYLSNKDETMFKIEVAGGKITEDIKEYKSAYKDFPKILLVMPPITLSEGTVKRVIPPLGLSYIGGMLKKKGIKYNILDCVVEGLATERKIPNGMWIYGLDDLSIAKKIKQYKPDIVGLSIVYSSDLDMLYNVAKIIKNIDNDIIVVAGGIHCTIYPREVLNESVYNKKPSIDFIIRGEGEYRFVDFLSNISQGLVDINADGLCGYYNGRVFINHQRSTIDNLDDLPLPDYESLPMEKYFEFNVPFSPFPRGKRVMQIYTSRGCPIGCTFCASTNFNKAYRSRSPENVISEIKYYIDRYDIDEIQFADDNLTLNKKRSIELFSLLEKCNIQWCTPNGIMINTLTQEVIDKMIRSGLYQITMSIDSGSARVLKKVHRKPVNLQRVPDFVNYLKSNNVLVHATLVVGMPGETLEEIDEGFEYALSLNIDSIGVFIAQALPGSELYEKTIQNTSLTRTRGRLVDTAQSLHSISDIPKYILEKKISDFIYKYNQIVKDRDPLAWESKYGDHIDRLAHIAIGNAAPNIDGIKQVIQPTPNETLLGIIRQG